MKNYKLLLILLLFSNLSYSFELITNSHIKTNLQTYDLPNGNKFSLYHKNADLLNWDQSVIMLLKMQKWEQLLQKY